MNIIFGLLIGIATGALQVYLLGKFINGITATEAGSSAGTKGLPGYIAAGMAQLLLPFAALIAVAFLYRDALLWAGVGTGTSLLIFGIIKALLKKKEG